MENKKHFKSLASRLSLWSITLGTAIFIAVIMTNYFMSRLLLEKYVEDIARTQATSTANQIETIFAQTARSADSLATLVSTTPLDETQITDSIKAFLDSNEYIFGMTVALEPGSILPHSRDFSPYFFRGEDSIGYSDLADESYEYRNWPWYTTAREQNTTTWSAPYMDDGGGNVLMTTYSSPIRDSDRRFAGVATADIRLSWLDKIVRKIKVGDSGYGFILSQDDLVIAHPDERFDLKRLDRNEVDPDNWQKYQNSKNMDSTIYMRTLCNNDTEHCWLALETLGDTGWKLAIVIPERELIADINKLTVTITLIAICGLTILFISILKITRLLTRPLGELAETTRTIGTGELDTELPEPVRNDEIGLLTDDFETMRIALKSHIEEIRETTAKKQKLESEIEIARDIQMSMIPGNGEAFIKHDSYQLFARLRPARAVGGDLYYYQQSDHHLNFIIGDVSDKGVPAALFMAKTVTLYTRALKDRLSPAETLTMMNDILARDNDACMFVTALCGSMNLEDGSLTIANAGHMNPVSDRTIAETVVDGATALGLMEDITYTDNRLELENGESLVMYTDGISEAHNTESEQYTDEALLKIISRSEADNIKILGDDIIDDVDRFSSGTEQFDDITLLIIKNI
jgi:sigma-B regulation protein RsbU (phosphoserine phosphatase)